MKKILFLFIFFTTIVKSQTSYPYLTIDPNGGQIVILTLEQAQKLDNATEFSPLLWNENASYLKLVDSLCNIKLFEKDLTIDSLLFVEKNLLNKIDSIQFLNSEVNKKIESSEYNNKIIIEDLEFNKTQNEKLTNQLSENNKIIKRQNKEINFAIGFGIITAIVSFIASM
jgi:hypothetical protein